MAELYVKCHGDQPVAYAYGDPWVAQALSMDDIGYPTPEDAKTAWIAKHPDKLCGREEAGV